MHKPAIKDRLSHTDVEEYSHFTTTHELLEDKDLFWNKLAESRQQYSPHKHSWDILVSNGEICGYKIDHVQGLPQFAVR